MNNVIVKNEITNRIYEIRGVQVMLDSDLAELYGIETKRINEAVKNNPNKFPERFAFRISENEFNNLKSKISTSSYNNYGGSRKGHTCFTEQGIYMLTTIVKSKVAIEVSIRIMDAFVLMRKYISSNLIEQKYINKQVMKNTELLECHTNEIKILQETFKEFKDKKFESGTFYKGQIYDAYTSILDIFESTKKEIIIIDNYVDRVLLDIIKSLNIKITLITKNKNTLIDKYMKQYNNLKVTYRNDFHDRYFIIDKKDIYHCGASINGIGKSIFSITLMNDEKLKDFILKIINNHF